MSLINVLTVLDANDPQSACQVRLAVYQEQIAMCEQYIINHPEHKEYYDSVISHLVSWQQATHNRILELAEVKDAVQ